MQKEIKEELSEGCLKIEDGQSEYYASYTRIYE